MQTAELRRQRAKLAGPSQLGAHVSPARAWLPGDNAALCSHPTVTKVAGVRLDYLTLLVEDSSLCTSKKNPLALAPEPAESQEALATDRNTHGTSPPPSTEKREGPG